MVRTKADGATRVAAGGKAQKKTASRPVASPGSDKGGKDHLPGNRACPRETPAWQKKITFFCNKNEMASKSTDDDESSSSNSKNHSKPKKSNADDGDNVEMEEGHSSVLESSQVDESESMETDD